jgi:hypothetical protein
MKVRGINFKLLLKWAIPLALLLCLATYQLAFKKTLEIYQAYQELNGAEQSAEALTVSPAYSIKREAGIEKLYDRFQVDTLTWKNRLWNQCAVLSQRYDCAVQGFPVWRPVSYGGTVLLKQEVVFSGSFHKLLKLQYALDTTKHMGLIGGLSYLRSQRDQQTTLKLQLLGLQPERQ